MQYRRNIDKDLRDAERRWRQQEGDLASSIDYAKHLLRIGQLELTEFPLSTLRELFPDGVSGDAILYGVSIETLAQTLKSLADSILRSAELGTQVNQLLRNYNLANGLVTLIWFPDTNDLSWRYSWKRFNRESIRIREGEIDEENLSYNYAMLQIDFVPTHPTEGLVQIRNDSQLKGLGPPFTPFNVGVEYPEGSLPSGALADLNYFDERLNRSANYLVLIDEIPEDYDEQPSVSYGRCEDYPCCGHDTCPPREESSGIQLAISCICGKLLPNDSTSSLCDSCLDRGQQEYNNDDYDEDIEDDWEEDDEDEDKDGDDGELDLDRDYFYPGEEEGDTEY